LPKDTKKVLNLKKTLKKILSGKLFLSFAVILILSNLSHAYSPDYVTIISPLNNTFTPYLFLNVTFSMSSNSTLCILFDNRTGIYSASKNTSGAMIEEKKKNISFSGNDWLTGVYYNISINTANMTLSANSSQIYNMSGIFFSPVMDTGSPANFTYIYFYQPVSYKTGYPDNMGEGFDSLSMINNSVMFHFDNSSVDSETLLYDSSGNGNNAVVSSLNYNKSGLIGSSAFFSKSYIDIPQKAFIINGTITSSAYNFSISLWFLTNGTGTILSQQNNVTPPSVSGSNVQALYIDTSGKLRASVFWLGATTRQIISSLSYDDNNWHNAVVIYNNGIEHLYVDNQYIGNITYSQASIGFNTIKYYLGTGYANGWASVPSGWNYFYGLMDEFAVFNRILSKNEIALIYKRGALSLNVSSRSCSDSLCSDGNFTSAMNYNLSLPVNRYFQYKASLSTLDSLYSPYLMPISLNYTMPLHVGELSSGENYSINAIFPSPYSSLSYYVSCNLTPAYSFFDSETRIITGDSRNSPVISQLFPYDSGYYNEQMTFNISADYPVSCLIYNENFSLNNTNMSVYSWRELSNYNGVSYLINVSCCSDLPRCSSILVNFSKDIEYPAIFIYSPDNLQKIPTSVKSIFANITFLDDHMLYNYNVSLYLTNDNDLIPDYDDIMFFSSAGLVDNSNRYDYASPISIDNHTGNILLYAKTCDAHTGEDIISANGIVSRNNYLGFQFKDTLIELNAINEDSIMPSEKDGLLSGEIKQSSLLAIPDFEKKSNRYEFGFSDFKGDNKKILLTSNQKIVYLLNSKYKGHFIIADKYWVDFEQEKDVIVEKSDGGYVITIDEPSESIKFNSIGELNCIEKGIVFYHGEPVSPYNINLMPDWFNNDALDFNTTAGMLVYFFLLAIIVVFGILSFATRIPFVFIFTGIAGFFYGWLLFITLSAIIGALFMILSILFGIIGFLI
jgi:hypothetical protein